MSIPVTRSPVVKELNPVGTNASQSSDFVNRCWSKTSNNRRPSSTHPLRRRRSDPTTIQEVLSQLAEIVELGLSLKAEMIFLSILRPDVPPDLERKILAMKRKHQNRIAIHVLTALELDRGRKEKPVSMPVSLGKVKEQMIPSTIHDFLPRIRNTKNKWVKRRGDRAITF